MEFNLAVLHWPCDSEKFYNSFQYILEMLANCEAEVSILKQYSLTVEPPGKGQELLTKAPCERKVNYYSFPASEQPLAHLHDCIHRDHLHL